MNEPRQYDSAAASQPNASSAESAESAESARDCACKSFGRLVLLRHGQTAWSESGQHTGRTDIPLTETGRAQAQSAGARILAEFPHGFDAGCVFSSPLRRAAETARLAGFDAGVLPALAEWDYGRAEGRTRGRLAELNGGSWDMWKDGPTALPASLEGEWVDTLPDGTQVTVHNGAGESLTDVYERVQQAIDAAVPLLGEGHDVLFVAHAHVLRILTMRWLGVDARAAKLLRLDTAHYSVLSVYKGDRVIERWNC
ncbi:histidine phosphatase family protein [Bifidobacterium jacchi]|uniref:phosphoglycerate mutase (2,3-diphosphoglycerate-dependent) n=1 Tax=Bifidobacterium jacchi TaxID=2490545 RepID=A0A5N5RE46_9BIFI|nr:histidine phosphatase family protein [Bifidobacterium jacchi]KAB5605552.1 histidine phosphatase family protein [Bifidobacterium jacchi]